MPSIRLSLGGSRLLAIAAVLVALASPVQATPPSNDDRADADLHVGGFSVRQSNAGATQEAGEPTPDCAGGANERSVWFTYEATVDGSARVDGFWPGGDGDDSLWYPSLLVLGSGTSDLAACVAARLVDCEPDQAECFDAGPSATWHVEAGQRFDLRVATLGHEQTVQVILEEAQGHVPFALDAADRTATANCHQSIAPAWPTAAPLCDAVAAAAAAACAGLALAGEPCAADSVAGYCGAVAGIAGAPDCDAADPDQACSLPEALPYCKGRTQLVMPWGTGEGEEFGIGDGDGDGLPNPVEWAIGSGMDDPSASSPEDVVVCAPSDVSQVRSMDFDGDGLPARYAYRGINQATVHADGSPPEYRARNGYCWLAGDWDDDGTAHRGPGVA